MTSLAAFRYSFDLAYYPPFERRITQNQNIEVAGHQVHKLKQLYLGTGLISASFTCHVLFPNMPVHGANSTTHLKSLEHEVCWWEGGSSSISHSGV